MQHFENAQIHPVVAVVVRPAGVEEIRPNQNPRQLAGVGAVVQGEFPPGFVGGDDLPSRSITAIWAGTESSTAWLRVWAACRFCS